MLGPRARARVSSLRPPKKEAGPKKQCLGECATIAPREREEECDEGNSRLLNWHWRYGSLRTKRLESAGGDALST